MESKACCTCKVFKFYSEFHKTANFKDGLSRQCKTCKQIRCKEYYERNKEIISQRNTSRDKKKREQIKLNNLSNPPILFEKYCSWCKCIKSIDAFNKNIINKSGYEHACKDCKNAWRRAHYELNKTKINAARQKHIEANKEKIYERTRNNVKRRLRMRIQNDYNVLFMSDTYLEKATRIPVNSPEIVKETGRVLLNIKRKIKEVSK